VTVSRDAVPEPPRSRRWYRRKRTWAAAAPVWLIAYVLSFGPACRIYWRSENPYVWEVIDWVYWPIDVLIDHGPEPVSGALRWYMERWRLPEWDAWDEDQLPFDRAAENDAD
jgi:hypothetical protein